MDISTTTKLPSYACVIDNALPQDVCDILINQFVSSDNTKRVDLLGYPTFTELNLNDDYPEYVGGLVDYTRDVLNVYKNHFGNVTEYLPSFKRLEGFRIKRYNEQSDDRFDTHVDVASIPACPRALSFLYYLNDGFEGGETHFEGWPPLTPQRGSVLVFPPYWMFPHAGLPVQSGTKYIMSTYLHIE